MKSSTVSPSGSVNQTPSSSGLSLKLACNTPWALSLSNQITMWSPGVKKVVPGSMSGMVYLVRLLGSSDKWYPAN